MKRPSYRIVILGGTSRIAMEVARAAASDKKELLLVARDAGALAQLAPDLKARGAASVESLALPFVDSLAPAELLQRIRSVWERFDVVLIAFGTLQDQAALISSSDSARSELEINFVAPALLSELFANEFEHNKSGCLAVITSVAGDRGRTANYIYGSAKGGLSLYLQGLRNRLSSTGVRILTIKPGPVRTPMTANMPAKMKDSPMFSDPEPVGRAIWHEIKSGNRDVLYVPWYWRYVMSVIRHVPEKIGKRLNW